MEKMKLFNVTACKYDGDSQSPSFQVCLKTDDYSAVRSLVTMLMSHEYYFIHVETLETEWFELC